MRIVIDAGHGGHDSGAVAPDGTQEKDVVLEYAKTIGVILENMGHDVMLTRTNDDFVGLTLRAHRADDFHADALLSIHANASINTGARGAWIIYDDKTKPEDGKALANSIFNEIARIPDIVDGDHHAEVFPDGSSWVGGRQLTVISRTKCPAVLVELGFLTNPSDLANLKKEEKREAICQAIVRGTLFWAGEEASMVPPPPDPTVVDSHTEPLGGRQPVRLVEAWRHPVREIARPEQDTGAFIRETLTPMLAYLGPTASKVWKIILDRLLARLEEEVDKRL